MGVRFFWDAGLLRRRTALNNFAMFHDKDAVGDVIRQTNVMGDEDHGHADFVAKLHEHIQDGGTAAGVDHRGGFIGQEDPGLEQEDAGDHQSAASDRRRAQKDTCWSAPRTSC